MVPSQTFQDHIRELRKRILWVILAIGISGGIAYTLRVRLIAFLQHPLHQPLFYNSPTGSFNFFLKLSTMVGIFVALPMMIYQLLRFIEPALPKPIKRSTMFKVIGASFTLALLGIAFGYYIMIPMSLHFFAGYSSAIIRPIITADEYLSYLVNNLIIFALVFQIPLAILFINRIKPIRPQLLLHYQRHVVVGAFAFAVVLPFTYDPITQFVVAIPIVVLFYLSVILLWITNRKHTYPATAQKEIEPSPVVDVPALEPVPAPAAMPMPQVTRPLLPIPIPAAVLTVYPVAVAPVLRRPTAMDGFLATPKRMNPIITTSLQPQRRNWTPQPTVPGPQTPHKRPPLAIDGISSFMPSTM